MGPVTPKTRLAPMPAPEILASAQPFGFGPVSKLVQIASYLDRVDISFVGEGSSLRYAQLNDRYFARVDAVDIADAGALRIRARDAKAILSVMEPRLVYVAVRERKPVFFFDSLLDLWASERTMAELAVVAATVRTGSDDEAWAAFESLTVHESMLVSHMLATRSYAQLFPGASRRMEELLALGIDHMLPTGPMIDVPEIERASRHACTRAGTLVANLGGFNNAFLAYPQNGAYIDLILRWLVRVAERGRDFHEIVVCSGAFGNAAVRNLGGVRFRTGLLPHAELMRLLAGSPVYLIAPGLTSLHEAVAMSNVPMLLPAQHYGHVMNRAWLGQVSLSSYATSFDDLGLTPALRPDDFEGTRQLAEVAARIHAEPELFDRFADYMDRSLARFVARPPEVAAIQVQELRELLTGQPIGALLASLQEEVGLAVSS